MKKYITYLDKISFLHISDPEIMPLNIRGCVVIWFSGSRHWDQMRSTKGLLGNNIWEKSEEGLSRESYQQTLQSPWQANRQIHSKDHPLKEFHSGWKWLQLLLLLNPPSIIKVLTSYSKLVYLSLQVTILMLISSS